jgi:uroporphyrinogen-III synthase
MTSQNAVEAFFAGLSAAGRDARTLSTTKVAAVGAATAEALRRHGVTADFVPSEARGECLAAELPRVSGARVLLGVGNLNEPATADALRARGAHIEEIRLYRTDPAPLSPELEARVVAADAITFASGSSARFLKQALGERELHPETRLCAIGPQAAAATREAFGRLDAVAAEPSLESLVDAVVEVLR